VMIGTETRVQPAHFAGMQQSPALCPDHLMMIVVDTQSLRNTNLNGCLSILRPQDTGVTRSS
jgi:hypothetical protein